MFVLGILLSSSITAQDLTQVVRGTIIDESNRQPILGATVSILGLPNPIGAITDSAGRFRIEHVPLGRQVLEVSFLGYERKLIPNVLILSGREMVLDLTIRESIQQMDEVVVKANDHRGQAINQMSLVGSRSVSAEETSRFAGGFNDPSRIVSSLAGVNNTGDGSNDIIVRGNSPKYIQWRLEGVQITNPNHFGDQSAVGGSISTLNNNLLATSDFHTGAFSAEFGNVLSGVYDIRMRAGNNEKFESVIGVGVLGIDLTLEGPFKKGYGGSYLVNYRYSTAGIADNLGLVGDLGGVPKFQDAAFKVVLPTKKAGTFSFFGLGGWSSFDFEDVTPALWVTPGDNFMKPEIREDYNKKAYLANLGLKHTLLLNKKSYLKTTLSYSLEGNEDQVFENLLYRNSSDGLVQVDSVLQNRLNYHGDLQRASYRVDVAWHHKFNARNKVQLGTKYMLQDLRNRQSHLQVPNNDLRFTLVDFTEKISTWRNFINWRSRINEDITLVAGVHHLHVPFNQEHSVEPRLAVSWKSGKRSSFQFGYGRHSTMESLHNYFTEVIDASGKSSFPNLDLGLLKADHFVLGYERRLGRNLSAKMEAYYQNLFDIPVQNDQDSHYATLNEGLDFNYVDLVNDGTGKNYGVELTVERFFSNNYYFLANCSVYASKYTALDGIERNTRYNGDYLVNFLAGKEFSNWGKKKNQSLGLNAKVFFGGGQKVIPLLRDAKGDLAVQPEQGLFWDTARAYQNDIEDLYLVVLSATYTWNRPKATHELFITLDNLTNHKGKISEFYDEQEPGSIGYVSQFGIFPNIMYRVSL